VKGRGEFSLLALFQENVLLMDLRWKSGLIPENVAQHAFDGAQEHKTKMVDAPTMLKAAERC